MGKNKLERFAENENFACLIQQPCYESMLTDHPLKGNWANNFFHRKAPLILELGCGKGEYTIGLARSNPDKLFIGADIKGARLWYGAKQQQINNLTNVGFLRTRIEFINSFFAADEVNEIWLTFPDPQEKRSRIKKRLLSPGFLNRYRAFTTDNAAIHLKTDNRLLYEYTLDLIQYNHLELVFSTDNLYSCPNVAQELISIQTFYEKEYLRQGKTIRYICFRLPKNRFIEPSGREELFSVRL